MQSEPQMHGAMRYLMSLEALPDHAVCISQYHSMRLGANNETQTQVSQAPGEQLLLWPIAGWYRQMSGNCKWPQAILETSGEPEIS